MKRNPPLLGTGDPDEDDILAAIVKEQAAKGKSAEDVIARIENTLPGALPEIGTAFLGVLKQSAEEMLAQRRKYRAAFQRRLRKTWRAAFDLLRMLVEISVEAGSEFDEGYRPRAVADQDLVYDALIRLHARSCLVANEVLCLLEDGFASGAMARWRTLHEIAVVAFFISEQGRDVANRYLLHAGVESYKAAIQYQEHCAALGKPPLPAQEVERLKAQRDALCQQFGDAYKEDWGWAAAALAKSRVTLADIEKAVSLSHWRPYFKLASYSNHAGSKGLIFDLGNTLVRDDDVLLAGPSDAGLLDPGISAARSLVQVATPLLLHATSVRSLTVLYAMRQLSQEIEAAFSRAEARLAARAKKLVERRISLPYCLHEGSILIPVTNQNGEVDIAEIGPDHPEYQRWLAECKADEGSQPSA